MKARTNARIAGVTFLLYIATGIIGMVLSRRIGGQGTAGHLTAMAQHSSQVGVDVILALAQAGYALVLGVTLYALTRDEDRELALIAMCCRAAEGFVAVLTVFRTLALLWLATAATAALPGNSREVLASLLLKSGSWTTLVAASCFAVASLIFSYLFLRARTIPVSLAWIGVIASALLVVALPLQLAGFVKGTMLVWIPMIFFEVPLGIWLLVKGVAVNARATEAA